MSFVAENLPPAEALRAVTAMSVADPISRWFPVNYKVFNQPGPFADLWRAALAANPFRRVDPGLYGRVGPYAVWSDLQALAFAALTPSGLSPDSRGLCAPAPSVESVVDFGRLKHVAPVFTMDA